MKKTKKKKTIHYILLWDHLYIHKIAHKTPSLREQIENKLIKNTACIMVDYSLSRYLTL